MTDYRHELQFGVFIAPLAEQADAVVALAQLAEASGVDLVTFQDHPYQPRFLDTWTLLSVLAAKTSSVRLAPNVANLPLRLPSVLARSVASLDILSGGRVELGLGAGAFWDGIAAMGGRKLTPGQSVDALSEAIDVIRAIWDGPTVRVDGEHYRVHGAKPGPKPAHPGRDLARRLQAADAAADRPKADGWLPSMSYLDLAQSASMSARIDAAAADAGRSPAAIRRLLNVDPGIEPEQLAELALQHGFSTFVMSVGSTEDVRRLAQETAPAVRELVDAGRGGARRRRPRGPRDGGGPFAVTPTPDDGTARERRRRLGRGPPARAVRLRPRPPLHARHSRPPASTSSTSTTGSARSSPRLRDLIEQVAAGHRDPAAVRSFINRMTIRQNGWTLGAFCASYCRVVTGPPHARGPLHLPPSARARRRSRSRRSTGSRRSTR